MGRKMSVLLPVLLLALALEARGQEIRFNVLQYRLDNGLTVLALEDHSLPSVSYYTFFRVGSRNERPGRTGISHLFEHMMFNGAKKYGPGAFDRQLEARGGFSNAFTAEDATVYYEAFPKEALELVIDMEADRMAGLQISEESLASEREVVKEERRLRVDNDVQGAMAELLQATAYLAHPYRWPIVGWMADLDAITVADCQDYFRTHYAPNNATIVLVGDFDPKRAIELLSTAFGPIPAQPQAAPVVRSEPPQRGERRAVLKKAAQLPAVAVAYHVPGTDSTDLFALDLLEVLLGDGDSSRLVRSLVYERGLASRVSVDDEWRLDPSTFVLFAEARPGVALETLEAALLSEVEGLGRGEVEAAELRKAKNVRTVSLVKSLKTHSGKAEEIGRFEVLFRGYAKLFDVVSRYEAVTTAQIREVAARYLHPDNRTVVTLVPTPEEATSP